MELFNEQNWPKDQAVRVVRGSGEDEIAVFMDPMCMYCQKLTRETLIHLKNVTIYAYIWPFLSEDSKIIGSSILSSPDPAQALIDWMARGALPQAEPSPYGNSILEQNIELADELGLQGTPAIFLADGHGPYGAMSAQALTRKMESAAV